MEALDEPYMRIGFVTMIQKRAGWLCALFLSEMLTATAMQYFEGELSKAQVRAHLRHRRYRERVNSGCTSVARSAGRSGRGRRIGDMKNPQH